MSSDHGNIDTDEDVIDLDVHRRRDYHAWTRRGLRLSRGDIAHDDGDCSNVAQSS